MTTTATVPPGDLLEYAARRAGAGAGADGDAIARAVGLARDELIDLITDGPIPIDVAAEVARAAQADPRDIWPGWEQAAPTRPLRPKRGAPPANALVDLSINRTSEGWRIDAYHAGTDEALGLASLTAEVERFPTRDAAITEAHDRYGDRIVRIFTPEPRP